MIGRDPCSGEYVGADNRPIRVLEDGLYVRLEQAWKFGSEIANLHVASVLDLHEPRTDNEKSGQD